MARRLSRGRGIVLRVVRRRRLSLALGILLAVPAAWIELGARIGTWWSDGAALIVGATGLALVWNGIVGASGDWID
jgi:hypothetical protein